jgi:outer membrane protein
MDWSSKRQERACAVLALFIFIALGTLTLPNACAEDADEPTLFTIPSSIEYALKHNTQILSSKESVAAAEANKSKQFTQFLPKLSGRYSYTRADQDRTVSGIVTTAEDLYRFTGTLDQPIFSGFSRLTQYEISDLGLKTQAMLEKQATLDLILQMKRSYFELLQKEKLQMVSEQAVTQLVAHLEVAKNFYDVGMIPRNDLLQADVELANARQDLVVTENNVLVAKSIFNTILRRDVDQPLEVEDILAYEPFTQAYGDAVEKALTLRTEILIADLDVNTAEKDITLSKTDYYPSVDLQANYYRLGDDPGINGGEGITDADQWDISGILSWTFWEWGKTRYGVNEKLRRLEQARLAKIGTEDTIRHEVKEAYLRVKEAENNILTAEKAVEQAKENYRINEERYKEQVATTTDVLDAQTLLTKTQNNYFNALSAFNISKAALERAMGLVVLK